MRFRVLLGVVCALLLVLPAAAFADTPSESAYSGSGAEQVNASSTTLPFTGIDVGAVAVAATVLLGTGLVLRRSTRAKTD